MPPLVFAFDDSAQIARRIAEELSAETGHLFSKAFPDDETYLRFDTPVANREVVLVCSLDRPDKKFLPLVFAAATARELGARRVVLIAPYLAYMRQDNRFQPGEAVSSTYFAKSLSAWFDGLVTIDPHLHRYHDLSEVYDIPNRVLHAADTIAAWIAEHVPGALIVGPDSESEQWVSAVAQTAGVPFTVLHKTRHGDRDVEISLPKVEVWQDRIPILVDDIISTARTMIETVGNLQKAGLPPPVCIGVHAIFADDAFLALHEAGARHILTCDTVRHPTNEISVAPLVAAGCSDLLVELSSNADAPK
ncbi:MULTISPECIES: ribose-phosphate pyrophosphokinase [Maricaulis]|jgi:ribose-phosphate pyrophosphokinase|uniref:ribose-phosphate diphosphokinase n=1 Tax=Maricaulis maris (strain MCS10) TaxID=394221 RepID=Q0ATA1_MARMM|nr:MULTISPECIES: ribose-phosphate pyrophosphokinase [Maricaulis]ABI64486.1 ribose-phosphate pyrophosphokinase [Maricaulis maris MCS10]MAC88662.1 phosphoribosylpyrophosphate synthetase [Maricaulis sp.]